MTDTPNPSMLALRIESMIDQLFELSWRLDAFWGADPPFVDFYVDLALLEATWLRGRYFFDFFLSGDPGVITARDVLSSWRTKSNLPKDLRRRLEDYRTHASQHVMHRLHRPKGDGGYSHRMVEDVFAAFECFVQALEEADNPDAARFRQRLDWIDRRRALPLVEIMKVMSDPIAGTPTSGSQT